MAFETRDIVDAIERLIDVKMRTATPDETEEQRIDRLAAVSSAKDDLERAIERAKPDEKTIDF
jgi:hypothetical protein